MGQVAVGWGLGREVRKRQFIKRVASLSQRENRRECGTGEKAGHSKEGARPATPHAPANTSPTTAPTPNHAALGSEELDGSADVDLACL